MSHSTMNKIPYFTYGSNLCLHDLEKWAIEHGFSLNKDTFEAICPAILPDRELCFDYYSHSRNCGVLNLSHKKIGAIVNGVLFLLSKQGLDIIDAKEGAPFVYQKTEVNIILPDGTFLNAFTYIVNNELRSDFISPSETYFNIVVKGMNYFKLPLEPLYHAANNQLSEKITAIFCYGSLQTEERLHHTLKPYGIKTIQSGTTKGILYSTDENWYPALLIPQTECFDDVSGQIITFCNSNITDVLTHLDVIEGFLGYGNKNLYERTVLHIQINQTIIKAWAYVVFEHKSWLGTHIKSGCWKNIT